METRRLKEKASRTAGQLARCTSVDGAAVTRSVWGTMVSTTHMASVTLALQCSPGRQTGSHVMSTRMRSGTLSASAWGVARTETCCPEAVTFRREPTAQEEPSRRGGAPRGERGADGSGTQRQPRRTAFPSKTLPPILLPDTSGHRLPAARATPGSNKAR